MTTRILLIALMLAGIPVFAQQKECEVKLSGLSGSYSGDCKNGLAHGKGIAQGTDHYEGQFVKGVPDGNGKYTWAGGSYYEGQWREGKRNGQGKMVKGDSVVSGIWKDDFYMGKKALPPYKLVYSMGITRYSITKVSKSDTNIRLRFYRSGIENADIEGFPTYIYSSGFEYHSATYVGIRDLKFPADIKVKFQALNYFHTGIFDVIFEFTVNEPGTWEVSLSY